MTLMPLQLQLIKERQTTLTSLTFGAAEAPNGTHGISIPFLYDFVYN
jgi:hypothetical protein